MPLERASCQAPDQRLISLQSTCLIAHCFAAQGLSVSDLLDATGLSESDLEQPSRLITPAQEQQVFANAARLANSALIGLELGQRMRISAYGQLGYAMLSSPTLGQALEVMLSYPVLLGSYFRLSLELLDDGLVALSARDYHESPQLRLFNTELCLSSVKAMLDDALGQPLPLSAIHLSLPAPSHAEHYPQAFGACQLLAQQDAERLVFDSHWLDAPLPLADPVTQHEALRQCQRLQERFCSQQSPLVVSLTEQLQQNLDAPPSLEQLAGRLHCTSRTLRRHLRQAGCGYQQLLDQLRLQQAKTLLSRPHLPIYAIAEQLGFSESASFRHAFIRWTGMTPRAWRQHQKTAEH
ncbi:AraC family transcriptional regulator [Pseudomonas sp. WN033]|nr:AraC family transcriptional regulator [Pseudomonas sp. WN033]